MGRNSNTPHILFADSNSKSCGDFVNYAAAAGWSCSVVCDCAGARAAQATQEFDVIVTEFELGGFDLLRELRHGAANPPLIVLMPDNHPPTDAPKDLLELGGCEFLPRTPNIDQIGWAVRRAVSLQRGESAKQLYEFVEHETTKLSYTAAELQGQRLPLWIAQRLWQARIIDLSTKLRLELAFQEAVNNAVEHGNLELQSCWREEIDKEGHDRFSKTKAERLTDGGYADRRVSIATNYTPTELSIVIQDEGRGFIHENPSRGSNEISCYGRGMSIINQSVDEVHYDDGGRRITMVLRLPVNSIREIT